MKKIIISVVMIFVSICAYCDKVAVLPELQKPYGVMTASDKRMYIVENFAVYIYSLKDYKFIKKFGKKGEGPEEFKGFMDLSFFKDKLVISSIGKISFYSKDGIFIKEQKTGANGRSPFYPFGEGYAGSGSVKENKKSYYTIGLFDSEFRPLKTLYKIESVISKSGKINFFKRSVLYRTDNEILYAVGKKGFILDAIDKSGKLLFSVNEPEYKKVKFTREFKNKYIEMYKAKSPKVWAYLKDRLEFPEFFPEIRDIAVSAKKIYIQTWERDTNCTGYYIYDQKGKLLKKKFMKLKILKPGVFYPCCIYNGKLFQIIDNENDEWELHVAAF